MSMALGPILAFVASETRWCDVHAVCVSLRGMPSARRRRDAHAFGSVCTGATGDVCAGAGKLYVRIDKLVCYHAPGAPYEIDKRP